ncbi:hypothetical protein MPSEU_001070600 [Mayamaea pseudoterrestris]|nr:hypothetical protein MPSEU_001070600 [Mayamaea pseudoterrestris]
MSRLSVLFTCLLLPFMAAQGQTASPSVTPTETSSPTATPWGGCVNPNVEDSDGDVKVTIGKPTYVCLNIANTSDWTSGVSYQRVSLSPKADQYSRLRVPGFYADAVGTLFNGGDIFVGAASSTSLSFLRNFYNKTTQKVYPFLTAIIDVRDGIINGITWDDACVFCGPNECEEITYNYNGISQTTESSGQPSSGCFATAEQCNDLLGQNGTSTCDLTLYVVWTGTDAKRRAFQSSASRFSAFPPQEIQNRIKSLIPQRNGRRGMEMEVTDL